MESSNALRMRVCIGDEAPDLYRRLANSKRPGRVLVNLAQRGLVAELEVHARLSSVSEEVTRDVNSQKKSEIEKMLKEK